MKIPEHLSKKSKAVWKDIERLASRKLNKSDYAILELLCTEIDVYDQAVAEIREEGTTNEHNQVSPAASIRNQAANNIRQSYKQIQSFIDVEPAEPAQPSKLQYVKNF